MMTPEINHVLGIETSCDDTCVAIYSATQGLLAHAVSSQIKLHNQYGGVVPELAARDHIATVSPLIKHVLSQANLHIKDIDGVAYTAGPGLIGALLVGASVGHSLGFGLNVPTIGVHHMEGHLLAPLLEAEIPEFPFIALLVSGGHTQLMLVKGIGQYQLLGESLDDAAGEAFDKTAKLLGLGYPGGPLIAKLAQQGRAGQFNFPRPLIDRPGLDFSFSGLKTSVLNAYQQIQNPDQQIKFDIAYAFQEAVVETLMIKCVRALKQFNLNRLVVAGGVGANKMLREQLQQQMINLGGKVYYPRPEFCTDNAAMIAFAGFQRLRAGQTSDLLIQAKPRWALTDLPAI